MKLIQAALNRKISLEDVEHDHSDQLVIYFYHLNWQNLSYFRLVIDLIMALLNKYTFSG